MQFRHHLQRNFGKWLVNSCADGQCQLRLDRLSSLPLIIDGKKWQGRADFSGKLCDCIVFYVHGALITAAVELKSGAVDISEAQEQIQNGVSVIEQITQSWQVTDFFPILLYGKIRATEFRELLEAKILFQGKERNIIRGKCGARLNEIIRAHK